MKLHHLFSAVPRPFKMPVAALGSRCGEQALMIAMWRRRWERALASSGGDGHVGTRAGCRHLDSAGRAWAVLPKFAFLHCPVPEGDDGIRVRLHEHAHQ